jgi:hypothetical protein
MSSEFPARPVSRIETRCAPGTVLLDVLELLDSSSARELCLHLANPGADKFQVIAHRELDQVELTPGTEAWSAHQQLLAGVVAARKRARIQAGRVTRLGANPLNMDLYCVPFRAANGTQFVIEAFVSELAELSSSRMARLSLLCEFFQVYIQSQELRLRADQADAESVIRRFVTRLNAGTTSRELAVVAVNEGRQVIGCERVSLGWFAGRRPQILSVSGHDSIDPRSNVIRALCNLTKAAKKTKNGAEDEFSNRRRRRNAARTTVDGSSPKGLSACNQLVPHDGAATASAGHSDG